MDIAAPEAEEHSVNGPAKASLWGDAAGVYRLLSSSKLNILLLCLPTGWVTHFLRASNVATFSLNLEVLVPLAWLLGCTTEELALRCGPVAGGLINATFGNAPELILSVIALLKGLAAVALASLLGSVLSNLLLVLGSCLIFGSLRQGVKGGCLCYDLLYTTNLSASMLVAAIMLAATFLSAAAPTHALTARGQAVLGHAVAILLIMVYVGLLISVLWTHKPAAAGEEDETPSLSVPAALVTLALVTAQVSGRCPEGLLSACCSGWRILGYNVLPLASYATDHTSAVIPAAKNKMDLAFGCCLGSAVQVAMTLLPLLTLIGWGIGTEISLGLDVSLALFLVLAALLVCQVTRLGKSDWLQGLLLVNLYVLIAVYYASTPSVGDDGARRPCFLHCMAELTSRGRVKLDVRLKRRLKSLQRSDLKQVS